MGVDSAVLPLSGKIKDSNPAYTTGLLTVHVLVWKEIYR